MQRFRQQRQCYFFAWRQQQMAALWQQQTVSLLEPRQQELQQEQVEFCRPSPAAATERAQQDDGAWQRQQLWCWQLLQQAVWLPALWFASLRCYMEGGRIKHRWLHESWSLFRARGSSRGQWEVVDRYVCWQPVCPVTACRVGRMGRHRRIGSACSVLCAYRERVCACECLQAGLQAGGPLRRMRMLAASCVEQQRFGIVFCRARVS